MSEEGSGEDLSYIMFFRRGGYSVLLLFPGLSLPAGEDDMKFKIHSLELLLFMITIVAIINCNK